MEFWFVILSHNIYKKTELFMNENIQMNHVCFVCKVYYAIKKVFNLCRYSNSFYLIYNWSFDPLAIAKTLLTWYHKILFRQSWIPYYTGRNYLWIKNIFANCVFCLQIWNACTVSSMRHQKNFLLCIEHTFNRSPLYFFKKSNNKKMILNNKWSFWRELIISNTKY